VDVHAARASFLGLQLVSLWTRWLSSSAEWPWRFPERVWWKVSVVAVLSIARLWRASGSGWMVLRVGVVRQSQVVPSVLVSVIGLGCSC
jgi:hypothetical protein